MLGAQPPSLAITWIFLTSAKGRPIIKSGTTCCNIGPLCIIVVTVVGRARSGGELGGRGWYSPPAVLLIHTLSVFSKGAETTNGDLAVRLGV